VSSPADSRAAEQPAIHPAVFVHQKGKTYVDGDGKDFEAGWASSTEPITAHDKTKPASSEPWLSFQRSEAIYSAALC
jgi:hypothetical protein